MVGIDASRGFTGLVTGTERYAREVVGRLATHPDWHPRVYTRANAVAGWPPGVQVRHLDWRRLWTHGALGLELWRNPPDAVFIPAHVLPVVCRPPAIVTVHDLGYLYHPAAHTALQRLYLDWTTRRHARVAARIVADSTSTKADLVAHYGADPDRIAVVPLAAGPDFKPVPAAVAEMARARAGLPAEGPYVLHVGTLQPRKNLPRLVRAFARIAGAHPDLHLVLAGATGWRAQDLTAVARAAGVAGRVHLPGYVGEELLAGLYTGAVAVAVPSLYEGFGLTALEAMACGAPVVAANTSSLPEVVGDAAILVDPLDEAAIAAGLTAVVASEDERRRLTALGIARAAEFTWDRTAREVARAIWEVL